MRLPLIALLPFLLSAPAGAQTVFGAGAGATGVPTVVLGASPLQTSGGRPVPLALSANLSSIPAPTIIKPTALVIAPVLSAPAMPFPSLAGAMAEGLGIKRPTRPALDLLPALPDPNTLPRRVLGMILDKMASRQNWGDVAYAASNITTIEGKIRAQWMSEDAKADVREYFDQLSPRQREIAEAAFRGGLAETPMFRSAPDVITLDWVQANYPPRFGR